MNPFCLAAVPSSIVAEGVQPVLKFIGVEQSICDANCTAYVLYTRLVKRAWHSCLHYRTWVCLWPPRAGYERAAMPRQIRHNLEMRGLLAAKAIAPTRTPISSSRRVAHLSQLNPLVLALATCLSQTALVRCCPEERGPSNPERGSKIEQWTRIKCNVAIDFSIPYSHCTLLRRTYVLFCLHVTSQESHVSSDL